MELVKRDFATSFLARIFHESACGGPQGVGSEAYLSGTSQGPIPEDARKEGHIRGRSKLFMKYPGRVFTFL
jgi:hypothetical protein